MVRRQDHRAINGDVVEALGSHTTADTIERRHDAANDAIQPIATVVLVITGRIWRQHRTGIGRQGRLGASDFEIHRSHWFRTEASALSVGLHVPRTSTRPLLSPTSPAQTFPAPHHRQPAPGDVEFATLRAPSVRTLPGQRHQHARRACNAEIEVTCGTPTRRRDDPPTTTPPGSRRHGNAMLPLSLVVELLREAWSC